MSPFTVRKWLAPALVAGAAIIAFLAFGVFGVHTLFIDDEVSEAAPVFATEAPAADDEIAEGASLEEAAMNDEAADEAATIGAATDEAVPGTAAAGSFIDGAHPTTGAAAVLTDGGTQRVLRLEEDFATDNGPDLNVYLASSADGFGDEYIDLGDLKGNIGSQNYEIPADVDLSVYDTVVIWCVRFGVGFGSAELA
ncbi:MAG: DM13 domain-containing protein [Acidimicrobiia bacterium]|nr:DM13 domain-containing protein [Acidimicrobiia bacterium]